MNIWHLITLVFVICKVAEIGTIAHWPWWLVLLPSLVVFGVGIFLSFAVFIAALIAVWMESKR